MNTNSRIKWRLLALGLGAGLMGLLIMLITVSLQLRATQVSARLHQVDLESFRIADLFKEKLRYASDQMRRYASSNQDAAWEEYLKASQVLRLWIAQQVATLSTVREQLILKQMAAAAETYEGRASDLHTRMEATHEPGASLAEYGGFLEQARRLVDLGEQLGRAHHESRNPMLAQASETLMYLRVLVLVLLVLLFMFGGALALGVYNQLITPLRTELVQSQALAERNEKMASLGLLAAGVAHEVRTPLTAIKTALYIQQKKLEPGSVAQGEAQVIEKEILRLEHIVTDFLQFARPAPPRFETVTVETTLQQVERLLAPQVATQSIRLVREPSPSLQVRVDAAQLEQVLLTLVHNAADSIERGGTITLRARSDNQSLREGAAEPVVVVEVSDTGKGIAPEAQKRLFDPFFTTKAEGTGLGLSIAARVVELNGGALRYQTELNRGTTFSIVLPQVTC